MVGDIAQFDLPRAKSQRRGIPAIHQRNGLRDGFHPFGHHAQRLHQRGRGPHDPIGHAVQPQHQGRGRRNRADRGLPVVPQDNRPAGDRDDQCRVQQRQRQIHLRHDPHFGHEGGACVLDRLFGVIHLFVVMGEKLYRMNVRIGIDNAARHRRPRVG